MLVGVHQIKNPEPTPIPTMTDTFADHTPVRVLTVAGRELGLLKKQSKKPSTLNTESTAVL